MVEENASGSGAVAGGQEVNGTPALTDYVVNPGKRLVTVKFGKKITARDIKEYVTALCVDPRFKPDFSEIVDLSEVEELDVHGDELTRLADEADPFSEHSKRAFVARSAMQNHAARLYKILRANVKFGIFRSVGAAERWIGSGA